MTLRTAQRKLARITAKAIRKYQRDGKPGEAPIVRVPAAVFNKLNPGFNVGRRSGVITHGA